jgi:hypothetical protein
MNNRKKGRMAHSIVELLIVFLASAGLIGTLQDYFWLSDPQLLDADKVQLKYFAALLASIGHLLVILRRHTLRFDKTRQ